MVAPGSDKKAARAIERRLSRAIPDPRCELDHRSAFELLVATILSAQSTDARVNQVTPALFERWPTAQDLAAAAQEDVEEVVRSTGFYRNKARSIRRMSEVLVERHGGEVPSELDALVELPGVARKTANVVIGTAFGIPCGVIVDTHVRRVSGRLGLTVHDDPVKIERDLCERFPRSSWIALGHRLVLHGRYHCLARTPLCASCPLNELCPSRQDPPDSGAWTTRADGECARLTESQSSSASK